MRKADSGPASSLEMRTAVLIVLVTAAILILPSPSVSWDQTTAGSVVPTAKTPFMVPAGAPRVARVVTVHGPSGEKGSGRHNGWQSTGLYADAGSIVTVTMQSRLPDGMSLEIHVGCHTDKLFADHITEWHRFPTITRSFPVTQPTTKVASAFGGPLCVTVKSARDAPLPQAKIKLQFTGAVEAPYFVLGQTKLAEWEKVRDAPAPWGELVGHNMILHFPSEQVRGMNDPTPLLEWWDKVVAAEDALVGWPPRTVQERVVPDRQISAGAMHSGNPPSTGAFDQLTPFIVLLRKFGWEPLQRTLVSYQTQPNPPKATEEERQAEFVRRYSQNAKANLSGFFQRLGYACPPKVVAQLRDLPAFDYDAWRNKYEPNHLSSPRGGGKKEPVTDARPQRT